MQDINNGIELERKLSSNTKTILVIVLVSFVILGVLILFSYGILTKQGLSNLCALLLFLFGLFRLSVGSKALNNLLYFQKHTGINARYLNEIKGSFKGKVKNLHNTATIPGIINDKVVWYEIFAKGISSRGPSITVDFSSYDSPFYFLERFDALPFYIENETGKVLVYPEKADFKVVTSIRDGFGFYSLSMITPSAIRDYIVSKKPNISRSVSRYTVSIRFLPVDSNITVSGDIVRGLDPNGEEILIFKNSKKHRLLLTSDGQYFRYSVVLPDLLLGIVALFLASLFLVYGLV